MAFIKLNDLEIEVPDGLNVIQAAKLAGIEIPHYCYHPGLTPPANCRMCLVEEHQFFPPAGKIVPARQLSTGCTVKVRSAPPDRKLDGKYDLIVRTDSDRVKKAREDILEFLLIHHPLDCPVCDQAGECKLQDFSFDHGKGESRYVEIKNVPPKKDLGPHVLLYSTRCVTCTRCIRFCDEISGTGELGLVHRGSKNEIDIPRKKSGEPIQLLDNKLSGNVVDICPVGALKSKDFLFKSRPWFMKKIDSICNGCSVGCNITIEYKTDGIYRIKPRFHKEINQYWMCDDGRHGYHYVNSEDRLKIPMKRSENSELTPTSWADVIGVIVEKLQNTDAKKMILIGSAQITNEENYLLRQIADHLKIEKIGLYGRKFGDEHIYPKFKIDADKNPNTRGAKDLLGGDVLEGDDLWREVEKSDLVFLIGGCSESDLTDTERIALNGAEFLIVQDLFVSDLTESADLVLPSGSFAEKDGTFTNANGWMQRIRKAIEPPGQARADWEILIQIGKKIGCQMNYDFVGQIAIEISKNVAKYENATHKSIGDDGLQISI